MKFILYFWNACSTGWWWPIKNSLGVLSPSSSLSYYPSLVVSHWGVCVHILSRQRSYYFVQLFYVVLPGCCLCLFIHVMDKLSPVFSSTFLTCLLASLYSLFSSYFCWASLHWLHKMFYICTVFLIRDKFVHTFFVSDHLDLYLAGQLIAYQK